MVHVLRPEPCEHPRVVEREELARSLLYRLADGRPLSLAAANDVARLAVSGSARRVDAVDRGVLRLSGDDLRAWALLEGWGGASLRLDARGGRVELCSDAGAPLLDVDVATRPALAAWVRHARPTVAPPRANPGNVTPFPGPPAAVDAELAEGWDAATSLRDVGALILRLGLGRLGAYRRAGPARARPVAPAQAMEVLVAATDLALPLTTLVQNAGLLLRHTGAWGSLEARAGKLRLGGERGSLTVDPRACASAWVVRKPSSAGTVTSLELFDGAGQPALLVFHANAEAAPESPLWTRLLSL